MDFDEVVQVLAEQTPGLDGESLDVGSIEAVLTLSLSNSDCVPARKTNDKSNATHIAVTSGANESPNKVEDFFPTLATSSHFARQRLVLEARTSPSNVAALRGEDFAELPMWEPDRLTIHRKRPLNDGQNPSIHFGYGDDIGSVRAVLGPGDYLVFIRRARSAVFDVVGLAATAPLESYKHLYVGSTPSTVDFRLELGQAAGGDANPLVSKVESLLETRKNVVLYGPPGTGKTHVAWALADRWEERHGAESVVRVTFHPSYAYEDFVQGIRPDPTDPSHFTMQPGQLLNAIGLCAAGDPVLMVIDEINRADVARVFGELITGIEPDKRGKGMRLSQSPGDVVAIPPNLHFLGTMNTADKSVSLLDTALRRRFAFVAVPPDPDVFRSPGWVDTVDGIALSEVLPALNTRLHQQLGVSPDRAIGHALLRIDSSTTDPLLDLIDRFDLDVFPLVQEYAFFEVDRMGLVFGDLVGVDGLVATADPARWLEWLRKLVSTTQGRERGGTPATAEGVPALVAPELPGEEGDEDDEDEEDDESSVDDTLNEDGAPAAAG